MKRNLLLLVGCALMVLTRIVSAALNIPSDGSDGAFNPTKDIVVDLSLAPTGTWNANNTANAGKGIYDPNKWAVVFKYSSINIPSGVTVTFLNHPTHAPLVWLVSGNVTIAGTVNLNGQDALPNSNDPKALVPPEPGPGGFRGGARGPAGFGDGYGPGGGSNSSTYASSYGNPQIIPLIGGSGVGGTGLYSTAAAGGGAILIATPGALSITGMIQANGGNNFPYRVPSTSGGAIRLIAQQVLGNGQLTALTDGRIRIEAATLDSALQLSPATIAVGLPGNGIPLIFQDDKTSPTVKILSVDGVNAPADPQAPVISKADLIIQKNSTVQVFLQTTNFDTSGKVQVRYVQKFGGSDWINATFQSGNFVSSQWVAQMTFAPGFTTLQARATVP